ncbi:TPA: Ig-like domain-containing protein [Vibrio parahaemolyticus]
MNQLFMRRWTIGMFIVASHLTGCHSDGAFSNSEHTEQPDYSNVEYLQITEVNPPTGLLRAATQIPVGAQLQYHATVYYNDGTPSEDVSDDVEWHSDNTTVASVNELGIVTAKALGDTQLHAELGKIESNDLPLTVSEADMSSLQISGRKVTLTGLPVSLITTATYTDGSSQDVTQFAQWSSSIPSVATVEQGTLIPVDTGSTDIGAMYMDYTDNETETVINSDDVKDMTLSITPKETSIPLGTSQPFKAILTLDTVDSGYDTAPFDVTEYMTWSSESAAVQVMPTGVVKGLSVEDNITITASTVIDETPIVAESATLNVVSAIVESVSLSCKETTMPAGFDTDCDLTAHYQHDDDIDITIEDKDVTTEAEWRIENSGDSFFTVEKGHVHSTTAGTGEVVATFNDVSASETLVITDAIVMDVYIDSDSDAVSENSTMQMRALATLSDGTENYDVTNAMTWSVSQEEFASIQTAKETTPGLLTTSNVEEDVEITVTASGVNSQDTPFSPTKRISITNWVLRQCGDDVNATNDCLKVATDSNDNWFTSSPSIAVMRALEYTSDGTEVNTGDTYTDASNVILKNFVRFRQDGLNVTGPGEGDNESAGVGGQFYRWCNKLKELEFAGQNDWRRPTASELSGLRETNGMSLIGWPTSLQDEGFYWASDVVARKYLSVNLFSGNINTLSDDEPGYASCISHR